ncbi:MAG: ThiF family adenylyltransferase [Parcubacteria group bacterium]|nr:ThiF family adenylyltransferase [Parcubacteria group bacterium]
MRPRLKRCFYPIVYKKTIRIGLSGGRAVEIANKNGSANYLLSLCKGYLPLPRVAELVHKKFPALDLAAITRSLLFLKKAGILENAEMDQERRRLLPANNRERYGRQLSFFQLFTRGDTLAEQYQKILSHSTVTVIGVGGGGNQLAQQFAAIGIGSLRLIDPDDIELSNLNRQILFTPRDIGYAKTQTAARRIHAYNPVMKLETHKTRVDSRKKIEQLIKGSHIVVCSADDPANAIYSLVDAACGKLHIPWISFGIAEKLTIVGPLIIPGETKNYLQLRQEQNQRFPNYLALIKSPSSKKPRQAFVPPSFAPMFAIGCGIIVAEVVKQLTHLMEPQLKGKTMFFDIEDLSITLK